MHPLVPPAADLTPAEHARYARHLVLPHIGEPGQRRLKNAAVLCIGAGGLGSPILMYLAAAGVGRIGIVDDDVVAEHNLQRQVIHATSTVGTPKVMSAAQRLSELNPHITIEALQRRVTSENALELFANYDVIVDGTDNFATRYLANDACALLGLPYVWGSVYRFEGQASVFFAGHGPCYRCAFPTPPPPAFAPSCETGGVLGVLCATIGAVQATEVIKLITGAGDPLLGRILTHDALAMEQRTIAIAADPQCAICGMRPSISALIDYDEFCATSGPEITAANLATLLRERDAGVRDFLLLDVREPEEYAVSRIEGSVLLPQGGILDGSALATIPRDRQLILHCRSGKRSLNCLLALREAGFEDVVHVAGGILAWQAMTD